MNVLHMAITSLRICGIWRINSPNSFDYLKFFHLMSTVIGTTALVVFVMTLATDLVVNYKDLLIATDDGCYLAGLSVIVFKLYKFHCNYKEINQLTVEIYSPIELIKQSPNRKVLSDLKRNTFYEEIGFTFFVSLGGTLVLALVFFVPKEEGQLPIRAIYPFDTSTSPMYELAYLIQIYAVSYGLMAILMIDTVGLGLLRWLNFQIIILAYNYENCSANSKAKNCVNEIVDFKSKLLSDDESEDGEMFVPFQLEEVKEFKNSFDWKFRTCVKNHHRLIKIVNDFNNIFNTCMLMQLFSSFSMICLTGFQAVLMGAKNKTSLMKFVIYLGAALTQLLYWSYFGNELLYQRFSLMTSQWMSGWENEINFNVTSLLVIAMIQASVPFEIRAGKFFTMSLETFITILRNSYSFFALLTTVTDD